MFRNIKLFRNFRLLHEINIEFPNNTNGFEKKLNFENLSKYIFVNRKKVNTSENKFFRKLALI